MGKWIFHLTVAPWPRFITMEIAECLKDFGRLFRERARVRAPCPPGSFRLGHLVSMATIRINCCFVYIKFFTVKIIHDFIRARARTRARSRNRHPKSSKL